METVYGKVKPEGLILSPQMCELANFNVGDNAIIKLKTGGIEIHSTQINANDSQKIVNKYLIRKVGDALISGDATLETVQGMKVWRVPIILGYAGRIIGEIFVNPENRSVIEELSVSNEELKRRADVEYKKLKGVQ